MNMLQLPKYDVGPAADWSPLHNALSSNQQMGQLNRQNALAERKLGLAEKADTRAGEMHGMQMAQARTQQEMQEARMVAGRVQYIQGLAPEQRAAAWSVARQQPGFRDLPAEFDNFDHAAPLLLGKANEYLGQKDQAAIGLTRAQTAAAYAQADRARRENAETGLVPQYAYDDKGNLVPFVMDKRGNPRVVQLPNGMQALGPGGTAEARTLGQQRGQAQVDLPKVRQNAETTMRYVDEVLNDPNLENVTGWQARLPTVRSASVDTEERIGQLGGRAFLSAFESLKGGGQITEIEGKKATDALARLTNLKQSDAGFRQALEDFKREVRDLVVIAERRAQAGSQPRPAASGSSAPDPLGIR
jgi:hypothetical protein